MTSLRLSSVAKPVIYTRSGWMDTKGILYPLDGMTHIEWARAVGSSERALELAGWIKVMSNEWITYHVVRITKGQKRGIEKWLNHCELDDEDLAEVLSIMTNPAPKSYRTALDAAKDYYRMYKGQAAGHARDRSFACKNKHDKKFWDVVALLLDDSPEGSICSNPDGPTCIVLKSPDKMITKTYTRKSARVIECVTATSDGFEIGYRTQRMTKKQANDQITRLKGKGWTRTNPWVYLKPKAKLSAKAKRGIPLGRKVKMEKRLAKNPTLGLPADFFPKAAEYRRNMKKVQQEMFDKTGVWLEEDELTSFLQKAWVQYQRGKIRVVKGNPMVQLQRRVVGDLLQADVRKLKGNIRVVGLVVWKHLRYGYVATICTLGPKNEVYEDDHYWLEMGVDKKKLLTKAYGQMSVMGLKFDGGWIKTNPLTCDMSTSDIIRETRINRKTGKKRPIKQRVAIAYSVKRRCKGRRKGSRKSK